MKVRDLSWEQLQNSSRSIREVLLEDYGWSPLGTTRGFTGLSAEQVDGEVKPAWCPHRSLFHRLLGKSNGPTILVDEVLREGVYLYFVEPSETARDTMDFRVWQGYFETSERLHNNGKSLLGNWYRFHSFDPGNAGYVVSRWNDESLIRIRMHTMTLNAVDWLRIAMPADL